LDGGSGERLQPAAETKLQQKREKPLGFGERRERNGYGNLIELVSNLLAAVAGVSRVREWKCLKTWFMKNEGA